MSYPSTHETTHQIEVSAPPDAVFRLLLGAGDWPLVFPPSVYVERFDVTSDSDRLRIWATANGKAHGWVSRRTIDHDGRRIRFRQEVSAAPVAAMGGEWIVEERPGGCLVRLLHDFRAVDDDPEAVGWIRQAVDFNSGSELEALRQAAQRSTGRTITCSDSVQVSAGPDDVYAFLYDAARWEERLDHVARIDLVEEIPNLQFLAMDTRSGDDSVHTTESVRVCFPDSLIVYKQTRTPTLMTAHIGAWQVVPDDDGVIVTSTHSVVINPDAIPTVLGPDATTEDAAGFVTQALSRNSRLTLHAAKHYAERQTAVA